MNYSVSSSFWKGYYRLRKLTVLIVCILLIVGLLPVAGLAQTPRTDSDFSKIDAFVNARMKELNIPGLSLGIVKGNRIYYVKGYGRANQNGDSVQAQTPFAIGSMSKAFTATAIMQLAEMEKLTLDDPVQRYLPWFQLADIEASSKITVRNLLTHTSGLSTFDSADCLTKDNVPLEQFVRNLENTAISKPVGSSYQYCNINYNILGEIVQAVSGIPYEDYVQMNIFDPLQMHTSYTSQQAAKNAGMAAGYNSVLGFVLPTSMQPHQASMPSGRLISSAEDMCHFLIAQMNQGVYVDSVILSGDSVRQTQEASSAAAGYGMGWMLLPDMVYHNGDIENYHSHMRIMRDGSYGMVTLMNINDSLMPISLGKNGYESIPDGVYEILSGREAQNSSRNMNGVYLIINILIALTLALFIWRICRLRKWNDNLKGKSIWLKTALSLIFVNLLLPCALYLLFQNVFNAPWGEILAFGPGLGHFLLFLPVSLLTIGILKSVLLFLHVIRTNRNSN